MYPPEGGSYPQDYGAGGYPPQGYPMPAAYSKAPPSPIEMGIKFVVLVALVFALWFTLVFTAVLPCNFVPMGCDVYWSIMKGAPGAEPSILIVYGDGGLGDHELLYETLASPQFGVRAKTIHLDNTSLGNLKEYDLVIVEQARKMSTTQMKNFIDYAVQGGRLLWTGDAGAELSVSQVSSVEQIPDQYLTIGDVDGSGSTVVIGPWARKQFGNIIALNQLLGVNYIANYCQLRDCTSEHPYIGVLVPEPKREHRLIYGIAPNLQLHNDFGIVMPVDTANIKIVMSVDYGSKLITPTGMGLGPNFPIIVTGGLGERIAYYSVPPEQFVAEGVPNKYPLLIEKMYSGMLR